jgi:hypothetical protein
LMTYLIIVIMHAVLRLFLVGDIGDTDGCGW